MGCIEVLMTSFQEAVPLFQELYYLVNFLWTLWTFLSCHHRGWFATRLLMCQTRNGHSRQATADAVLSTACANREGLGCPSFQGP